MDNTFTEPAETGVHDYYVARGPNGYAIAFSITEFNKEYRLWTVDENHKVTISDPFKNYQEAETDLQRFSKDLTSQKFTIEEHKYASGEQTKLTGGLERVLKETPATEKGPGVKDGNPDNISGNSDRAGAHKPASEKGEGSLLDKAEEDIKEAFRPGHEGVQNLKQQLIDDTDESNWLGNAVLATGLDALDLAMGIAEGIPSGLLDTRNFGEGISEGTAAGFKRDAQRVLNIIPQGKALRAIDRVLMVSDAVEEIDNAETASSAAGAGGTAILSLINPKKHKKALKKGKWSWKQSERDVGEFLDDTYTDGVWKDKIRFKDGRVKKGSGRDTKDSTVPDFYNEKLKIAIEVKRYDYIDSDAISKFLTQAGGRIANLEDGSKQWLFIDHRGLNLTYTDAAAKHSHYFNKLGGKSVFEKIFIITDDGVFEF